jgi:hypothetical protein
MLQRCLAGNSTEERTAFFHEIRACRRRPQTAVHETSVGGVLCKEEELAVLHQRAVATRIKVLLSERGMGVGDAFALFDVDCDGTLAPEEMYDGLVYLGLHMTPAELRDLIVLFDVDRNGVISLDEFKAALWVPGLDDDLEQQRLQQQQEEEEQSQYLSFPAPPAPGPPSQPAPPAPPGGSSVLQPLLPSADDDEWALHTPEYAPSYQASSAAPTGPITYRTLHITSLHILFILQYYILHLTS